MPSYPHVQPLNGREINYGKRFNTYMIICTEQPRCLHPQRSEALKTEAKLKKLGIKRIQGDLLEEAKDYEDETEG